MRTVKVSTFYDADTKTEKALIEWYGLSTETKPEVGIAMGSIAFEVDTGKIYAYNETAEEWVEEMSLQS